MFLSLLSTLFTVVQGCQEWDVAPSFPISFQLFSLGDCWEWNMSHIQSSNVPWLTSLSFQKNIVVEYTSEWLLYESQIQSMFQSILLPQDQLIISHENLNQTILNTSTCVPTIWFKSVDPYPMFTVFQKEQNIQYIYYNSSMDWIFMPNLVLNILLSATSNNFFCTGTDQFGPYICVKDSTFILCSYDSQYPIVDSLTSNCTTLSPNWSYHDITSYSLLQPTMSETFNNANGIIIGTVVGIVGSSILSVGATLLICKNKKKKQVPQEEEEEEVRDSPVVVQRQENMLLSQWH